MTAFFSSLPPELVRQILSHLPRPSHGSPLPAPSPLLATALASPTLQVMSPELLFHSMTLAGEEYALQMEGVGREGAHAGVEGDGSVARGP